MPSLRHPPAQPFAACCRQAVCRTTVLLLVQSPGFSLPRCPGSHSLGPMIWMSWAGSLQAVSPSRTVQPLDQPLPGHLRWQLWFWALHKAARRQVSGPEAGFQPRWCGLLACSPAWPTGLEAGIRTSPPSPMCDLGELGVGATAPGLSSAPTPSGNLLMSWRGRCGPRAQQAGRIAWGWFRLRLFLHSVLPTPWFMLLNLGQWGHSSGVTRRPALSCLPRVQQCHRGTAG